MYEVRKLYVCMHTHLHTHICRYFSPNNDEVSKTQNLLLLCHIIQLVRRQWAKWMQSLTYKDNKSELRRSAWCQLLTSLVSQDDNESQGQGDRWHEQQVTLSRRSCSHTISSRFCNQKLYPKGGSKMESPMPYPNEGGGWETVLARLIALPCSRETHRTFHSQTYMSLQLSLAYGAYVDMYQVVRTPE